MSAALDEFLARANSIGESVNFIGAAFKFRPRLNGVLNRSAPAGEVEFATQFLRQRLDSPSLTYAALFVSLLGALERFLRQSAERGIAGMSKRFPNYSDLPLTIQAKNRVLTGRVLSISEEPRDHLSFDYQVLVANLAGCNVNAAAGEYKLNAGVFASTVTSVKFAAFSPALEHLGLTLDKLGSDPAVRAAIGAKGVRECARLVSEFLNTMARARNMIAHGGDEQPEISDDQMLGYIKLVAALAQAIDNIVDTYLIRR